MRRLCIILISTAWLTACSQPETSRGDTGKDDELLVLGDSITRMAFMELSAALSAAVSEKGIPDALQYCNTEAINITREVSLRYKARISRVSDRFRNPANAANDMERKLIGEYRRQILAGRKPEHQLIHTSEGKTVYYKPILLQPQCISCHGTDEEIGEEHLLVIKKLYPNDLATGFRPGDLRGMWKVEF